MDSDIGGKIIALYDRNRASGAAKPGRRAPEGSALAPYLESLLKNVLVPDPDQRDVPSKAMRRAETLTVKQMNLLEQVARGLRNREIADELGVSPHTVRNNLVLIMRKLGAKSRSAAVALAYSKER
jgi:DNA-binding CsgD family transcriptional regulator